jgi:hypothetical protein
LFGLPEPEVSVTESLERGPVRRDDIRVNRFRGREQPGFIFAEAPPGAALVSRAPLRLTAI